jgi:hypothetical protein
MASADADLSGLTLPPVAAVLDCRIRALAKTNAFNGTASASTVLQDSSAGHCFSVLLSR